MEEELAASRVKLKELEEQARSQLGGVTENAPTDKMAGLEEAMRMLMATLHEGNLPPQAQEAAQVVCNLLAPEPASEEVAEMVDEETVSPGRLDESLAVVVRSTGLKGKREELDNVTSDEDFLAWAKAAKKSRSGPTGA